MVFHIIELCYSLNNSWKIFNLEKITVHQRNVASFKVTHVQISDFKVCMDIAHKAQSNACVVKVCHWLAVLASTMASTRPRACTQYVNLNVGSHLVMIEGHFGNEMTRKYDHSISLLNI